MNVSQKRFANIVLIVVIVAVLVGAVGYFIFVKKSEPVVQQPTPTPTQTDTPAPTSTLTLASSVIPSLSGDRKSIIADGKVLLSIDDKVIFDFFKDKQVGMCDENNIDNTPARKAFCTDGAVFKSKTSFSTIVSSPDNKKIGFSIETDELTPDKVVGIFYPFNTTYKVHILTNYYLGNQFIGFSPTSKNFVYKGACFEGDCGIFVKDSNTLADKGNFRNPNLDSGPNYTFVRWIYDNEIEYKAGDELKRASF